MNSSELYKSNARIRIKMVEAIPESIVSKTVIKKSSGNTSILTLDQGDNELVKISAFDTLVQILEGSAEVIIEGMSTILKAGQMMILPAHIQNSIKANGNLRMISTMLS